MAIQKLLDGSEGIIAKVIVGLIIIVFALFGMGSITTFLAPTPKVASVGGVDVTSDEMQMALDRSRRILMAQNQQVDEDALKSDVLEQLIARTLLIAAGEEFGLHFGDQAVDRAIVQTEAFTVDGTFSPDQFRLVIGNAGFTPLSYRDEMRKDQQIRQLTQGIVGSAFLTRSESRRAASLADQLRDLAWLRIPAEDLKAEVEVSDADLQAEYDANIERYSTEETVSIEYIEIRNENLKAAVEFDDDEIREAFTADIKRYSREERRRFAHILIETNDSTGEDVTLEKIQAIAERITQGEDFATVAKETSQDTGSAGAGGDLGMQGKGIYAEPFEEAAYALELNQVSAPVQTVFGYHLIKLLGVEPASVPEFGEVRAEVEENLRDERAGDLFAEASDQLATLAFENVPLEDIAAELDLDILPAENVGRSATEGIMADAAIAEAAFSDQVLINSFNSEMIAVSGNHNVVLRALSHQPSEPKMLEDVAEAIRDALAAVKAAELARSRADDLVAMLESGSLTRFVADKYGLEWVRSEQTPRQRFDLDREILAEAFKLPRPADGGKSVSAISLANGDAAVVSVTQVANASSDATGNQELETIARALAGRKGGNDFAEFRTDLEQEFEVERY